MHALQGHQVVYRIPIRVLVGVPVEVILSLFLSWSTDNGTEGENLTLRPTDTALLFISSTVSCAWPKSNTGVNRKSALRIANARPSLRCRRIDDWDALAPGGAGHRLPFP